MYCVEEVESDLMYVNRFSYKRSMGRERTSQEGKQGGLSGERSRSDGGLEPGPMALPRAVLCR